MVRQTVKRHVILYSTYLRVHTWTLVRCHLLLLVKESLHSSYNYHLSDTNQQDGRTRFDYGYENEYQPRTQGFRSWALDQLLF